MIFIAGTIENNSFSAHNRAGAAINARDVLISKTPTQGQ
jgi:hypothetical protein